MSYLWEGVRNAFKLIFTLNGEILQIVAISLKVSTASTFLATIIGVPLGFGIAIKEFWGKRALITLLNTLLAMPTVVVGLLVYSLIARRGPLGNLELLYTPWAMIIGQFLLATPIVTALSLAAVESVDRKAMLTALTLGATERQSAFVLFHEARSSILAAVIAGFGRVFGEIGVSMMLGGNIRGYTRNITTAIALETGKGEFGLGIALGLILLGVAFFINLLFHHFKRRDKVG